MILVVYSSFAGSSVHMSRDYMGLTWQQNARKIVRVLNYRNCSFKKIISFNLLKTR